VAVAGWLLDKSAVARSSDPRISNQLSELRENLYLCPVGELEQLYSARSTDDYDRLKVRLLEAYEVVPAPPDLLDRALLLQQDLAHHHGMWHRTPIPDLLMAEIALHHGLGVVHVDRDYERIAEIRPLSVRRISASP
jgi:predicted nucleic acid-binding protein